MRCVVAESCLQRAKRAAVITDGNRLAGATQQRRRLVRGAAQSGLSRVDTLIIYVR